MPIAVSLVGGGAHSHALSPAERQAAQHALSKLSSLSGKSVASALHSGSNAATLSGGSHAVHASAVGSAKLISLHSDTFAGGTARAVPLVSHATAVAGSFGKASAAGHGLGADTIKVADHTAAGVKAAEPAAAKPSTITLSDKTTVTLTGVSAHSVVKAH